MFPLIPIVIGLGVLYLLDQSQQTTPCRPPEPPPGPSGCQPDLYGVLPPPPAAAASGASVLKSAALASPGSWTQRNVLQAGAQSAYARRLAGTATNADFAVLGAARPGIASGQSGPISAAWSGSPWQYGPGIPPGPRGDTEDGLDDDAIDDIADAVVREMGID